jgi:hypothetical protein
LQARFPFLDEEVVETLLDMPLWDIVDLQQPIGHGDKKILRAVCTSNCSYIAIFQCRKVVGASCFLTGHLVLQHVCSFQMLTCSFGGAGYNAGGYDPGVDWSSISSKASNTGDLWVFSFI